jgi:Flp pilus assembly protein TadG
MVTAETAMVLPVLMVLLGMCLWVIAVAGTQVRCQDAAYTAARAAARGEPPPAIEEAARAAAPAGAAIAVERTAERVRVTVSARASPGRGPLAALPGISVTGAAVALVEQANLMPLPMP